MMTFPKGVIYFRNVLQYRTAVPGGREEMIPSTTVVDFSSSKLFVIVTSSTKPGMSSGPRVLSTRYRKRAPGIFAGTGGGPHTTHLPWGWPHITSSVCIEHMTCMEADLVMSTYMTTSIAITRACTRGATEAALSRPIDSALLRFRGRAAR